MASVERSACQYSIILSFMILFINNAILFNIVLLYAIFFNVVLLYALLFYIVLFYAILFNIVPLYAMNLTS